MAPSFSMPWRQSTDKEEYDSVAPEETIPLDDESHSPADEIADLRRSLHKLRLWLIAISVPLPKIPIVPKTLDQDNHFAVVSSPESDKMWHSIIPPGGTGFVTIQNPRQYSSLKPGMPSGKPNEEVFGMSLFHRLHCVIHIRHHMWELEKAAKTHNTSTLQSLAKMNGHINHCFDFVRQALMCNADLTLEWPESVKHSHGSEAMGRADGNHIPHQCKDWGTIFDWPSKNAYSQDEPV